MIQTKITHKNILLPKIYLMKKTINLLCSILLLPAATYGQISIGPAVGAYITNYRHNGSAVTPSSYAKKAIVIDFKAGALADISLNAQWHLQPGLLYGRNSHKDKTTSLTGSSGGSGFHLYAVEIPVNITYKTQQKNGGHVFFSAGPYLAVNTNGTAHVIYTDYLGNYAGEKDVPLPIGKGGYRRFVGGAGANAGYETRSGFSVRAHFQKGLINLFSVPNLGQRLTSYNYGLTFAYMFPLKKDAKTKKK